MSGNEQRTYLVAVRNRQTGEPWLLLVASPSPEDAQVSALSLAFRDMGWRSCDAWPGYEVKNEFIEQHTG